MSAYLPTAAFQPLGTERPLRKPVFIERAFGRAFDATVSAPLLAHIDGFGARRKHLNDRVHLLGISGVAHYLDLRAVHELIANAQPQVAAVDLAGSICARLPAPVSATTESL